MQKRIWREATLSANREEQRKRQLVTKLNIFFPYKPPVELTGIYPKKLKLLFT